MQVIESPQEMQSWAIRMRGKGKLLALVPTMGALHEGHLSLIDAARQRADLTVVSIFVNPTQFGPNEDYGKYPRQLEADIAACEAHGADIVFAPKREEIFPADYSTYVNEEFVSKHLCGLTRPGHFRGVTTVVTILFNLCRPDVAIFGQKDAQQAAILKKMARDLFMPVEIVAAPIVREESGLALSSRNRYLEPSRLAEAAKIQQALKAGQDLVKGGSTSVDRVKAEVTHLLAQSRLIRIIYIEIVDRETMHPVREITPGKSLLAVAVWLEETRLIDNVEL
ncbi:pantoate--beta-alanine ligase [Ruficoccus amylovorans]|uniref:Pantothenate synthetase n=1 Tax=Ruficoccus amylovorans TaxID=1804625 RepID=A0A842HD48_9BACT|nr:pantoate--beta-alanine ligase [Ruficoccus amylovorans]MBC2594445.1 pantoate--beta-alanine ligase [Ruficoccus amylovorans]